MNLPFRAGFFSLRDVEDWVATYKPTQIEMNDQQYASFTGMSGMNLKTVKAVPIVFTDAPAI
jgi:hypothetical protein